MKIYITSIHVDDQERAHRFYTDILGFETAEDIPLGEHRWLTVTAAGDPSGVQLGLEPSDHPAVAPYRDALVADGIPITSFAVEDVQAEYERLSASGVVFTQPPLAMGPVVTAVLDDTCGNLVQIVAFVDA